MTPIYALSLSFEGIGLLRRVEDGWHELGTVALDSPDPGAALRTLREEAEPGQAPLACKLILPNAQIRYLTLDTGRIDDAARRGAAARALDGATPYAVEDLSFDIAADGATTWVAAVARETLQEADDFATEHGFAGLYFTSIPPEDGFPSEPFLGTATGAEAILGKGRTPAAEAEPVRITGHGPLPSSPAPETPRTTSETGDPAAPPDDPATTAAEGDDPTPSPTEEGPAPAFTSIRAQRGTPPPDSPRAPLAGASRITAGPAAPDLAVPEDGTGETATAGPPADPGGQRFDPAAIVAGFRKSKSDDSAEATTEADPEKPAAASPRKGLGARLAAIKPADKPKPKPKPKPKTEPKSKSKATKTAAAAKQKPSKTDTLIAPPPPPMHSGDTKADESERMTIFGAREQQKIGGKPRYLGLVLSVLLLLFLAGVAAWATIFLDGGIAGIFRNREAPQIAASDTDTAPETDPGAGPDAGMVDTGLLPASNLPDLLPDSAEIEGLNDDDAAMDSTRLSPSDTPLQDPDMDALPDPATREAAAPPERPDPASAPMDPDARYAATGIWAAAPEQSPTPTAVPIDDLYVASIDDEIGALDAFALPQAPDRSSDIAPGRIQSPPPPGTTFEYDERGLIRATPDGALTPDGVRVYRGKPAALPPAYPERAAAVISVASPELVARLAAVRPRIRPGGLVENNERAQLSGMTRSELASLRPRPRPETDKAAQEVDTTPTERAIASSLTPRPRPGNIDAIVRAARAAPAATQTAAAAPAASQTVAPSIPTTASVARQATVRDAINMRKLNLIGVYGSPSNRRALIRLSSGSYKKVKVGDSIDGGRVAAIGDDELRYVKSGRAVVLKMPKG
ncbi:hypothetical protein SAMN04490248_11284 [Salinihabitans flavidus]|uniref:Type IV pilus biogenesis protein PilP n=1 Tax=Salinihabitans flavidus TaxID=569882 RepID=A0A1H8SKT0_9RHOB|nr:hypothetical protein [Salinihabitans flavidus]SEO79167.1 hypothetical protein SAMN04490248_11284 [Salinihabitans flavidus]